MDRNLDIDNFERLLKDRAEEFKMYPTKRVWHSIYNNIHPGKKWPSIAMCIVLISILLLVGYLNTSNTDTTYTTISAVKSAPANFSVTSKNINEANFYNPFIAANTPGKITAPSYFNNTGNSGNTLYDVNDYSRAATASMATTVAVAGAGNSDVALANSNYTIIPPYKPAGEYNAVATGKRTSPDKNIAVTGANTVMAATTVAAAGNNLTTTAAGNPGKYSPVTSTGNVAIMVPGNGDQSAQNTVVLPGNNVAASAATATTKTVGQNDVTSTGDGNLVIENDDVDNLETIPVKVKGIVISKEENKAPSAVTISDHIAPAGQSPLKKADAANAAMVLSSTDKAWIENYALYNRPVPKKWAGKLGWQLYITPSVVYRNLKNTVPGSIDINKEVVQHPSIGMEIGGGIIYPIFKGVRIKTGLQFNFTRYNTDAFENSHPVATSITLNDEGEYYHASRTTPFSNNGGITPVKLHNDTYQVGIPIGVDFKILGNDNLQWNVGTTIQPTYVFGGQSYLISSDKRNFIRETSLLNRWNLNAGFETFVSYKVNGYTFQFGPQFRKQLYTTNTKMYTVEEKLNNYGIKFGITKLIK